MTKNESIRFVAQTSWDALGVFDLARYGRASVLWSQMANNPDAESTELIVSSMHFAEKLWEELKKSYSDAECFHNDAVEAAVKGGWAHAEVTNATLRQGPGKAYWEDLPEEYRIQLSFLYDVGSAAVIAATALMALDASAPTG